MFAARYVVVKKLGWGHFSTVWMARDDRPVNSESKRTTQQPPRYVALKVRLMMSIERVLRDLAPTRLDANNS